jgi:hypothetical protein
MGTEVKVFGRVRKLLETLDRSSAGNAEEQLSMTEQLELAIAHGTAPYGEIVRVGRAFEVHTVAAIAAVVALPTTAAMLSLQNMEADGARALVIDRVWALNIAHTAAAGQQALIGCLGQTRVAALGALSALPRNPLNGNGGSDSKSQSYLNAVALDAVTGVAGNWRLLPGQTGFGSSTALPGAWQNAEINGRIIVAPGRVFGVHVLADLVGSTYLVGIEWHEKLLTLG